MKVRFIAVVLVLLVIQAAALLLIWGTPAQHTARSNTPTAQPRLPSATVAPSRTPLPVIPQATMPPPTSWESWDSMLIAAP